MQQCICHAGLKKYARGKAVKEINVVLIAAPSYGFHGIRLKYKMYGKCFCTKTIIKYVCYEIVDTLLLSERREFTSSHPSHDRRINI